MKLAQLEPMVAAADWVKVREAIAPHLEDQSSLSPELALLYALALHEMPKQGDPDASPLAIDATAALLGVPVKSPIAVLVAKRLLRKARTGIGKRPAPRWPISLLIAILALAAGLGVGWLISLYVI